MSKRTRRDIPRYETPIIETHCHMDYLEHEEQDTIVEKARASGVERIITIAVAPENLSRVRSIAAENAMIWGTQGIHPHEAEKYDEEVANRIREGLQDDAIVAVGEIGLDYYYDHADRKIQRQAFERQLQIAVDEKLPVVIHTRDADADTQAILRNFAPLLERKGVIHSFTSGEALADFCLQEGFCLGFNGITTFNRAENVRDIVRRTPIERILLETDAPYLTPVPYRGKPNAPCYLPFIAETIAELKHIGTEELLGQARQNSMRLFFPAESQAA